MLLWALVAAVAAVALIPAGAAAYPSFDGSQTFPAIQSPAAPEDFSWEVNLDADQELRSIDDQNAAVYYTDPEHLAFSISAMPARDAVGVSVPTTIAVSEGNVLTLTVHHRAGNPATGAPFVYPIVAGAGWEGGFQTVRVEVEFTEGPASAPSPSCRVPNLRGHTLRASRRQLKAGHCALGPVHGERSRGAKVTRQYRPPGKVLPAGTAVGVKLG